ncbi:YihY/virulence factor BrkB family protein [Bradyrhizobium sp. 186]|nr:YihY/virulence factor BrkB family protein [Bradyrhizobium sp. 186]
MALAASRRGCSASDWGSNSGLRPSSERSCRGIRQSALSPVRPLSIRSQAGRSSVGRATRSLICGGGNARRRSRHALRHAGRADLDEAEEEVGKPALRRLGNPRTLYEAIWISVGVWRECEAAEHLDAGVPRQLAALGAVVVIPVALNFIGLSNFADLMLRIARWPAMFVAVTLALAAIYRYRPSRQTPRWRWVTWGSALAALLWIAASGLFSWYAASFGKFNETYGSLGAVIGFVTWLWISAIVILIGAELDAEMEHQTMRDTTTGSPKPMGKRGPRMADTVGQARSG